MAGKSDIGMDEVSSVVGKSQIQIQQVQTAVERMNSSMDKFAHIVERAMDKLSGGGKMMQAQSIASDRMVASYERFERSIEQANRAEKELVQTLEKKKQLTEFIGKYADKNPRGQLKTQVKEAKDDLKLQNDRVASLKREAEEAKKIRAEEAGTHRDRKAFAASFGRAGGGMRKAGSDIPMRRGGDGVYRALDIASDMNLPGVSHAATMAKYARMGAGAASEGGALEGMGSLGMAGGLGLGVLGGGAVLAAGYTAMQAYKTYNTAHQMAPMARTLRGQGGGVSRGALDAYGGYGGAENWQALASLNRQVGSGAGAGSLHSITDLANSTGLSRDEVGGQAGALMRAGGASPGSSAGALRNIMIEGVKGGMDRARITEFTNQIVGIQGELFKTTGQNNSQGIAAAIGSLMSGGGAAFLHGPAMQAVGGIDNAMKSGGRLQLGGAAQGTMARAFGFGAGGEGGVGGLLNYMRKTEGGIFSGKNLLGNINSIFDQYNQEGGGKRGGKLSDNAKLRMAPELGIGVHQLESLDSIRGKKPGEMTKAEKEAVKAFQEQQKDPMERLNEITAKTNEGIAKLASSDGGIGAILKVDESLLEAQQLAVGFLQRMADVIAPKQDVTGTGAAGTAAGGMVPGRADGRVMTPGDMLDALMSGGGGTRVPNSPMPDPSMDKNNQLLEQMNLSLSGILQQNQRKSAHGSGVVR